MKIAVVTPYYREPIDTLRQCCDSVRSQTVPCHHYLVADGYPQEWIDRERRRDRLHLKLPSAHADGGGTPRALGALLAIADDADAVAFLDADNRYDADHIAHCLDAARRVPGTDYVGAWRRIELLDGTVLRQGSSEDDPRQHIDTSCFFLLPGAFHTVAQWLLQPRELSSICDRLYDAYLKRQGLVAAYGSKPTVTYVSRWATHYRLAGRPLPPDAKENPSRDSIVKWLGSLSPRQMQTVQRLTGLQKIPL